MSMPAAVEHVVLDPASEPVYVNGHGGGNLSVDKQQSLSDSHDSKHSRMETVGIPPRSQRL